MTVAESLRILVGNVVVAGALARAAFEAEDHHFSCVTCAKCRRKVPQTYAVGGRSSAYVCAACDPQRAASATWPRCARHQIGRDGKAT